MRARFRSLSLVFWILGLIPTTGALAQSTTTLDLITLKNGDFHHGTVAQETIALETPYGTLLVPYGMVRFLKITTTGDPEGFIITRDGAKFSGKIRTEKFFTMRPQEPSLIIQMADVAEIEFGRRLNKRKTQKYRDALELANGDSFPANLSPTEFMVKTLKGLSTVKTKDTFLADISKREDDETNQIRISLNAMPKRVQGTLINATFTASVLGSQEIKLPVSLISTAAFNIRPQLANGNKGLHFEFHKRVNPGMLIQDTMEDGEKAPELVVVRGAKFMRGGNSTHNDFDEKPALEIALSNPFAIGLYEVTFDEYDRFCEATDREKPGDADWGRGRRPVINVSWEEAVAYTKWLSEKTGQTYRLPTDAEWEYAAKAGKETKFWWGDEVGIGHANCAQCGSIWDAERTARVGKFPPNPLGLHDTAGNVFEWVADCYHSSFEDAPKDGAPLEKDAGCGKRVIRGGAWSFPPKEVRSANRWRDFPTRRSDDTGFRVLRELED